MSFMTQHMRRGYTMCGRMGKWDTMIVEWVQKHECKSGCKISKTVQSTELEIQSKI